MIWRGFDVFTSALIDMPQPQLTRFNFGNVRQRVETLPGDCAPSRLNRRSVMPSVPFRLFSFAPMRCGKSVEEVTRLIFSVGTVRSPTAVLLKLCNTAYWLCITCNTVYL